MFNKFSNRNRKLSKLNQNIHPDLSSDQLINQNNSNPIITPSTSPSPSPSPSPTPSPTPTPLSINPNYNSSQNSIKLNIPSQSSSTINLHHPNLSSSSDISTPLAISATKPEPSTPKPIQQHPSIQSLPTTVHHPSNLLSTEDLSTSKPNHLTQSSPSKLTNHPNASQSTTSLVSNQSNQNHQSNSHQRRRKKSSVATTSTSSKPGSGGIASALAMSGVALLSTSQLPAISHSHVLNQEMEHDQEPNKSSISPNPYLNTHDVPYQNQTPTSSSTPHGPGFDELSINNSENFEDNLLGTGYAIASRKRNLEFHSIFKGIPEDDYLIEDYGCALQRDILVQGRLYVSEQHLCFNANIFGWVTSLVLPFSDVATIEKRMTALIIPNAIQVMTMHSRYTFASFISRDATYDLINNIWKISHPSVPSKTINESSDEEPQVKVEYHGPTSISNDDMNHSETNCDCLNTELHYKDVVLDTVYNLTPEKLYNLLFQSDFLQTFWQTDQQLTEIEVSDWKTNESTNLPERTISYIKPLNASMGPKSCKCELAEEAIKIESDNSITTLTRTRTPDVPAGSSFVVLTRTCLMWSAGGRTRVIVTTSVEWTKVNRFLKSIIESSALSGQRAYHSDLDRALKSHIQKHFEPEDNKRRLIENQLNENEINGEMMNKPNDLRSSTSLKHTSKLKTKSNQHQTPFSSSVLSKISLEMWISLLIILILIISNLLTLFFFNQSSLNHHHKISINQDEINLIIQNLMEQRYFKDLNQIEIQTIDQILNRFENRLLNLRSLIEREKDYHQSL